MSVRDRGAGIRRLKLFAIAVLGAMTIAVATSSAQGLAGGPSSSTTALGGFTSQGWPVVLEVARGGRLVAVAATGLELTCSSGQRFPIEDGWSLLDVGPNGAVRVADQIPPSSGQTVSLTGGSHSLTGRLNRDRSTFRGVWRLHLTFKTADGQIDQCRSGRVVVTAKL
jgi:hypothetical protein